MREGTSTPLLLTKITVPPQRAHVIPREGLLQRMPQDGPARLIVLSAPAGAGKTTCLAHWCQTMLADGSAAVAWYSLDTGDNDPARFAAYLLGALSAATATADFQAAGALLETIPGQGLEPVLAALLNAITLDSRQYVLVLDDYHTITAPEVHLAITFLLDHTPAQLRVVIGSRATPPLHLARLRVRDQLVELRAADLRFSTEEVRDFFDQSLDFPLTAETAQLIEDSSEGWAAGLQLIALSLMGHGQAVGEATLRETLTRLALSRHHIFDYLADEVFEQQAPETRRFLLATSALGRLSAELCDAVIDGHSSRAMLEQLERSNLFVVPLDVDRGWYRYHHLFGDFLEERREREQPEQTAEIHRRASAWYRAAGMITPAIEHALASTDYAIAGELIDSVATTMNARGEAATLRGWLERLPQAVVEQRPDLSLWWAWSMIFEGKLAECVSFLDRAEHAWSAEHNQAKLGGVWHARAHLARIRGDAAETLRNAQQALADLPEDANTLRAGSILALGAGYLMAGDLRQAERTLHHAQVLCRDSNFLGLVTTSVCLGDLAVLRGQYGTGVTYYEEALALADGRQIMGYLEARIKLADVWRERNDLESAQAVLQQALAVAERTGYAPHLAYGYIILGRVLRARGEVDEAGRLFEHGIEVAEQAGSTFYQREAEAYLARLRLVQGDTAAVAAWHARWEATRDESQPGTATTETLTDARILIAQDHADTALARLGRLRVATDTQGQVTQLIEIELLRALALEQLHRRQEALLALECALRIAAPANIARIFLDEGSAFADLLGKGQAIGGWGLFETKRGVPVRAYARDLLTALTGNDNAHAADHQHSEDHRRTPTGETISAREIEVLRLMARGASNQEIADTLIVSLGTVKSHLTHIMGKLQARNRTEAVARSRELGYLPT